MNFELVKQVMSEDVQRRAFRKHIEKFQTENMLFVVLQLNHHLKNDSKPFRIQKELKKYLKNVDNEVFSVKSNKRLRRYSVIENLNSFKGTHIQMAIEIPNHLNKHSLTKILKRCANNKIIFEHRQDVYDFIGLADYNTKDTQSVKPTQTDKTFDEVNSYFISPVREVRVH